MKMIDHRTRHTIFEKVEIKDYNFMMGGINLFNQPIDSMAKTYENIRKIATRQGHDYTT